jgi:hypothetical protein
MRGKIIYWAAGIEMDYTDIARELGEAGHKVILPNRYGSIDEQAKEYVWRNRCAYETALDMVYEDVWRSNKEGMRDANVCVLHYCSPMFDHTAFDMGYMKAMQCLCFIYCPDNEEYASMNPFLRKEAKRVRNAGELIEELKNA